MYPRRVVRRAGSGGSRWGRIVIALVIAAISLITYFGTTVLNPVTGEEQRINISVEQEVALGLQAAPQLAQEYGGLDPNDQAQALVEDVGEHIVAESGAGQSPYDFEFYLLDDPQTINAFALPGGPVFITEGLLSQLDTEGQLAGVLAHEITHVVARHSAEQIARMQLTEGLTGAAVIAAYDPDDPSTQRTAQVALLIGQLVNMKFGRDDELESDRLGVRWMSQAGYDPRAMLAVMEVLAAASQGNAPPEFFSTHPNPENRIANIEQAIRDEFPNGVPEGLVE